MFLPMMIDSSVASAFFLSFLLFGIYILVLYISILSSGRSTSIWNALWSERCSTYVISFILMSSFLISLYRIISMLEFRYFPYPFLVHFSFLYIYHPSILICSIISLPHLSPISELRSR